MSRIVTLTQAGHYFAIKPIAPQAQSTIEFLESSVIDGATMSLKTTVKDANGDLDFTQIANRNYFTTAMLTDYIAEVKTEYFDTPTFFGEVGSNYNLWYVFYLVNAGAGTAINIRLTASSENFNPGTSISIT